MNDLAPLDSLDMYHKHLADAEFWAPYVQVVCRRHGLVPAGPVRSGTPGTFPVMIANERWVVKFFGRLFNGETAFRAEQEAARLVALDPAIPTARLLASGRLAPTAEGWSWPYLIYERIAGPSIAAVFEEILPEDRLQTARILGGVIRRLHALPLEDSTLFSNNWDHYLAFLQTQRAGCQANHHAWGSLPTRLVEQIEDFLPPLEELVDRSHPPHLIHADLTGDHWLGQFQNGRWTGRGLIDFGDARSGNLLYELAALHLDLFRGEKPLLWAFLDGYGWRPRAYANLPRLALATALLHQFNVFWALPPALLQVESLDTLAERLWRIPREPAGQPEPVTL